MKQTLARRKSLRARLLAGLACMLLPLLLLGAGTLYSFRVHSNALSKAVAEALGEMAPVSQLQGQVHEARIALHRFVHHGDDGARDRYVALVGEVETAFARCSGLPLRAKEKRLLLQEARASWQQGRGAGAELLEASGLPEEPALDRFDRQIDQTLTSLDRLHELAEAEIAGALNEIEAVKRRMSVFNTAILGLGTGMVLLIGGALARSILRPLRLLEAGAMRFAGGDLAHRLAPGGQDELGALIGAFNAMAQQLERDQKSLRELSIRDPLTGLYNHREFFRLLRRETERSRRYRHPLALLMLDLDFFKLINDTHGHQVGDRVLSIVAEMVRRELRQVDHIARYGGEEFAGILTETAEAEALAIANRIRQAIAARPLPIPETDGVGLTVSIGVAIFPDDADSEEDLVKQADLALYQAKTDGRNRVCKARRQGA